jgi:hypothetical protein
VGAWAAVMLISSGLFAGDAVSIAWDRLPSWRRMPLSPFISDFADTIRRADRIQPALLVVALATAIGFGLAATGSARVLSFLAAGGFVVILAASLAVLVPLQRRMIGSAPRPRELEAMRQRWFLGHLGRSALAVVSFTMTAIAAAL